MKKKYIKEVPFNEECLKEKSIIQKTSQKFDDRSDNQNFYYETFSGKLLGSKVREKLITNYINNIKERHFFLEVGCAQGYYLEKALKKTKNVFGVDISKSFVVKARKTGANVRIASGEKLPFKKDSFDFVLCTETIEHIPEWKKSIKEMKRVLKKNGLLVITIPLEKSFFWRAFSIFFPPEKTRGHINLLSAKEIECELKSLTLIEKKFVQTMSQTINRIIPQREKISMYCFFVFKK